MKDLRDVETGEAQPDGPLPFDEKEKNTVPEESKSGKTTSLESRGSGSAGQAQNPLPGANNSAAIPNGGINAVSGFPYSLISPSGLFRSKYCFLESNES
jgi:hypothetical protein